MNRPDFLQIGNLVLVDRHWHGVIEDVAETDGGKVMVLLNSPKAIWRNHRPEWLEYQEARILPATWQEAEPRFDTYIERVETMLSDLEAMKTQWANKEKDLQDGSLEKIVA
jgi:hypothetical protein